MDMTPDENALASVLSALSKERANWLSHRRDLDAMGSNPKAWERAWTRYQSTNARIAALEAERDVLATRVRATKEAK